MLGSIFSQLRQSFHQAERWLQETPDRSIEEAYRAAIAIQRLEDEHFDGQPVRLDGTEQEAIRSYFQAELNQHLRTIRNQLTKFRVSRIFVDDRPSQLRSRANITRYPTGQYANEYTLPENEYTSEVEADIPNPDLMRKLKFIDAVIDRYRDPTALNSNSTPPPAPRRQDGENSPRAIRSVQESFYQSNFTSDDIDPDSSQLSSASFIPRSILRTARRFQKELNPDPGMEEEIIRDFRSSRSRTRAAMRFLLLLIILPLLTQQVSKQLLIGPVVNHLKPPEELEIHINPAVERKVLDELTVYKERLEFNNLLSQDPLSAPELDQKLREKAQALSKEYEWELREPIKNIFADFISLIVFAILIATGRREIAVLKVFFDEILYGLSDSAKAFILILFTDVFVGFHSPHGWEVIMEGALEHFGLPQNRAFINMFIATFPVMLDTVFKYWIFRYLNQVSPSAVATYRNMNE
ncbi:proton extrusion protein PcxA [Lyngbya confervoides]|uniref:Proton extrusion protein PxcA n=1 Tax=Lyngbya confervoides BDU141951 TaxID=1574623 RepID=A0ABD4TB09_9CYAN|nr:proton extrusion protein PcxA [Lyngbya confervoides]MCM1985393.1 proton extrusion protein PcxA [Lyngbya confervoides BDU141951]